MSFSASRARALDETRPVGTRVLALYGCLDFFAPFGFNASRDRLRLMTGAGVWWTGGQVTAALGLLTDAKRSWRAYSTAADARRRAMKLADRNAPRPSPYDDRVAWLRQWAVGDTARLWRVDGLGDCQGCGHEWILHCANLPCRACYAGDREPLCHASIPS